MVSRGEFMRRAHVVKSWPAFFQAIIDGDKNFEVRYDDRHYQRGDVVLLREFDPAPDAEKPYTGREVQAVIGWVQHGSEWGLADGFCAFSLVGVITPEQLQAAAEAQMQAALTNESGEVAEPTEEQVAELEKAVEEASPSGSDEG